MQKYVSITKRHFTLHKLFVHSSISLCWPPLTRLYASTASIAASTVGGNNDPNNIQRPSLIGSIEQPTLTGHPPTAADKSRINEAIGSGTAPAHREFPAPPNPELCCGSGCPNCVWIQYAEDVLNYVKSIPLHNGVEDQQKRMVKEALKQNVADDNLRIYLLMEIQAKGV